MGRMVYDVLKFLLSIADPEPNSFSENGKRGAGSRSRNRFRETKNPEPAARAKFVWRNEKPGEG